MTTGGDQNLTGASSNPAPPARRLPLPVLIAVWVLLALVAVAGLVTITIGWGHDAWASTEAEGNVKTVQAIVLGLGFLGVVAGAVVTYRRQQTMQDQLDEDRRKYQLELDKFTKDQEKYADEQVRETARRQQERYAQGAQMLADQSPAVRIAGLNVIAALGSEVAPEDELRQTCVNLICAYLRASSPATPHTTSLEAGQQEPLPVPDDVYRVAAAEACRLLPTLLTKAPADGSDAAPPGLDLDLRQVHLIDLNLGGHYLGMVRCGGATFTGGADFRAATFTGGADFRAATFTGGADFDGATFKGDAIFRRATFSGPARFDRATFLGNAWFVSATFLWDDFPSENSFAGATFAGKAGFGWATFKGSVEFDGATFLRNAWFYGARFHANDRRDFEADFAVAEPLKGAVFRSDRPEQPGDDGEEDASSPR